MEDRELDLKQIKQIVDMMKKFGINEVEIEEEGFKLRLKRGPGDIVVIPPEPNPVQMAGATPIPLAASAEATTVPAVPEEEKKEEIDTVYIKSPMVGTFYRAHSPDSPPFVEAGTEVEEDTVLCIIEAMKVMNEIQAEMKGSILEVLVENGVSVEYGQPIFKIKQA